MIKQYKKRPIPIKAVQWEGEENLDEVLKFCEGCAEWKMTLNFLLVHTLEGTMRADIGDYIVKGVDGEFYPCKASIFEKTYEEIRTYEY